MGKGNKQTTTQQQTQQNTQSTAIDPKVQQQAYANLDQANNVADDYRAVYQQAPAGFTADQQAGFDATRAAGSAGNDTLQSGINAAQGAATYQPLGVTSTGYGATGANATGYGAAQLGNIPGYTASMAGPAAQASGSGYTAAQATGAKGYNAQTADAASLNRGQIGNVSTQGADQGLGNYLQSFNPAYQSDVIDASTNDLNRARILAMQGNDAKAAQQGAFGGSRQGLVDAATNDDFARAAAANSANLRQSGFNTGLQSFQTDQARQLQAQQANQGADVTAATTNAGFGQQANLQNAQFQNQAAQYGADQGNQFTLHNADAQNQAAAFGAQAQNQANLANAAASDQVNLTNAGAKNQAGQFNSGLQLQGELANQNSLNQAGQFNAGAQNANSQFNAGAANTAGQFNAGANLAAQQANQQAGLAGAGLNLQGANTLGNFAGQQQLNAYNNAGALSAIGGQQQQQDQNALNVAYQNAQAQQQAPLTQLGIQQSALGLTPYGTTTTGNGSSSGTTTQTQQMGLGSSIMGLVGGGLQAAGAAGGFGKLFSDKRFKENIKPMKNPLEAVHKMTGVNYDWKPGASPAGLGFPTKGAKPLHDAGLLAQDVKSAIPGGAGKIDGKMHYSGPAVMGLLVEAVKHLDKKVSKR